MVSITCASGHLDWVSKTRIQAFRLLFPLTYYIHRGDTYLHIVNPKHKYLANCVCTQVMNSTENTAPIFNNMYNRALHTALENEHHPPGPPAAHSPARTLESLMVKTPHSFTNTENDDVFMKDDIIGQYSNNSYEVSATAFIFIK